MRIRSNMVMRMIIFFMTADSIFLCNWINAFAGYRPARKLATYFLFA
jgi:hypothetical protein